MQKPSIEINIVYESSLVLKKMSCDLSEISTAIVNASDDESIDEILASESRKWTIASAKKKIFILIAIYEAFSKNSTVFDIETSNNSFAQDIVDMKISKKKIFESTRISAQKSKNSFVSYFKHIEISIAVNISSLEYLINENDFAIETFDFVTELDAYAKNPLIQHTENSETMKKTSNSIYIYELSALSVFDLNIDINFEIYTIDSVVIYSTIQASVTSSRRKIQLSSFRDLALRNISFD